LTFQKEDTDADIFSNPLATRLRPVNYRPVLGREEALGEDVVCDLGQTFKIMFGQFDALRDTWVRCMAMKIHVAEPEAGRYVLFKARLMTLDTYNWTLIMLTDDEPQSALWSLANTLLEEVQDGVACFDNTAVFAFPMSEGSELSLDVALAENLNNMNDLNQWASNGNGYLENIPWSRMSSKSVNFSSSSMSWIVGGWAQREANWYVSQNSVTVMMKKNFKL
jgi:hypothetical protein